MKREYMHFLLTFIKSLQTPSPKSDLADSTFPADNHSIAHTAERVSPRCIMVKAMDCGIVVRKFELLRSLSDKYPWERYEPPYPPSYG